MNLVVGSARANGIQLSCRSRLQLRHPTVSNLPSQVNRVDAVMLGCWVSWCKVGDVFSVERRLLVSNSQIRAGILWDLAREMRCAAGRQKEVEGRMMSSLGKIPGSNSRWERTRAWDIRWERGRAGRESQVASPVHQRGIWKEDGGRELCALEVERGVFGG